MSESPPALTPSPALVAIGPDTEAPPRRGRRELVRDGRPTEAADRDHWLVRNPLRTAMLLVLLLSLAVRFNVMRDGYFITDDFMLQSRAMESPLTWSHVSRVHTGHFEPLGFTVMWLLAHLAPWNWGVAVALLITGMAIAYLLAWRMLVELFGRRWLTLVPFTWLALTPLTLSATTWLSAAILWTPTLAVLAGLTTSTVQHLRTGSARSLVGALAWLVVGLLTFEKILIALPWLLLLGVALRPAREPALTGLRHVVRARWRLWAGFAGTAVVYVIVYLASSARDGASPSLGRPTVSQVWDFTYLSLFRTLIPALLGGPWTWQGVGYGGAMVDSPRWFDWLTLMALVILTVLGLVVRRGLGRQLVAVATYVGCSLAMLAIGRVAFGGSILALEARYLADAVVPIAIALGAALMPYRDEAAPWLPLGTSLGKSLPGRSLHLAVGAVAAAVGMLSIHATNGYATFSTANPYRPFVEQVRASLHSLPADAQIYDTNLPVPIVGPIFEEYDLVSRFVAPALTTEQRASVGHLTQYSKPYFLDTTGRFQPMRVEGTSNVAKFPGVCGWLVEEGRAVVPLQSEAFPWGWAVRVGYLSDRATPARITLGTGSREVQLDKGLGEVFVPLTGGGRTVAITGVAPGASVCIGDVQVGKPALKQ
ncbi:MAG: hypothetical protein IPM00_04265 [Tetrasphaera sp.]|jgi:hypothetical protein|nr:hypothetical protein [Tetrasphaera sp.]